MELEIFANDAMEWCGDFAVATETGPYAHQTGSFEGKLTGTSINAECETGDGTQFQLTGTANGDASFNLTRSDIPGVVLTFLPVKQMSPVHFADTSFILNSSGTNARAVVSTSPYSSQNGLLEYRGTWNGVNLTFWSYSSGYASLAVQVNDWAIGTLNFTNYKITDTGTAKLNSASGNVQMWSPTAKVMFKFGTSGSVSPG